MKNRKEHKIPNPVAITLCCPHCDYAPMADLFYKLPISNYMCNYPNKIMSIRCPEEFCNFRGTIIEWTRIIFE